jgi:hypothetical protein
MTSRDHAQGEQRQAETEGQSLLPCPLCGAGVDDLEIGVPHAQAPAEIAGKRNVYCHGCGVESAFRPTEGEAVAAWNGRLGEAKVTAFELGHVLWRARKLAAWGPVSGNVMIQRTPWPPHESHPNIAEEHLLAIAEAKAALKAYSISPTDGAK